MLRQISWYQYSSKIKYFLSRIFIYSCIPITRAGSIKRAGRIFLQILINEQVLIRASRLEKIKILAVKLQSGRNFHDIFKNEQALLRASRLENDQKFLVRACSRNRDTRVHIFTLQGVDIGYVLHLTLGFFFFVSMLA